MLIKWIDGKPYVYDSRWEDGRAVHEYLGPAYGEQGRLMLGIARLMRDDRRRRRQAEAAAIRRVAEDDRPVERWARSVEQVYRAALEAVGYRLVDHHWRRKRMARSNGTVPAKASKAPPAPGPKRYTHDEAQAVLDRAQKGDAAAIDELRGIAGDAEWHNRLVNGLGNVNIRLEERLIELVAGQGETGLGLLMVKHLHELREKLRPKDASPLERLLVDRVVVCWLSAHVSEIKALTGAHAPAVYRAMQRGVDSAHRRLMSAVRALRDYRRLDIDPAVLALVNVRAEATVQQGADP